MNHFSAHINISDIRGKLLAFSRQFQTCFFYDSNAEQNPALPMSHRSYDILLGIGKKQVVALAQNNVFNDLEAFQNKHQTWLFGYLTYDLKNEIEALNSSKYDALCLPEAAFIEPQIIITVKGNELQVISKEKEINPSQVFEQIIATLPLPNADLPASVINPNISSREYIDAFTALQKEITYGNIYEINYCMAFEATLSHTEYEALYLNLNEISSAPFSAFVKLDSTVIISASPERFIKKIGNKIISQPIKGTARRGSTEKEDETLIQNLLANQKERSENVMITDLVRNDLSKHAARNSVHVDELFGIYSFKQVHQMISTVSATLKEEKDYIKVIRDAFPMGSMTGAPKIMAMKLIEHYEKMKRGLYSGALGYIDPNGNYDFNVLIRSIIINTTNNKAQFCVGSAITADANAQDEYNECLLKANAMMKVLG